MIIGVDPSLTSTGLCINGECYLIKTTPIETADPLRATCERIRSIMEVIYQTINEMPDVKWSFYIEGPMYGPAANHLFEMGVWFGNFYTAFGAYKIVVVNPATLKKFLGIRVKKEVPLTLYKKYKVEFQGDDGDDKAHAYALYRLGLEVENDRYTLPEPKRRGTGADSARSISRRKNTHTTVKI